MLRDAARNTASWSIRNMATVGGNLFTPPPGGDVAVALLALDASVTLASPRGERTVPLADFFTGFMTDRRRRRRAARSRCGSRSRPSPRRIVKFGRKHANTPAVVTVAARVAWDGATSRRRPHRARRRRAASDPGPRGRAAPGRRRPSADETIAAAAAAAARELRALHGRHRHGLVPPPDGRPLRRPGARAAGARGAARRARGGR